MGKLRRTVAVVDDDTSLRRSVGRLLNDYGFAAVEYASAEAFLRHDVKTPIDCLVLDIDLGGMSGIELRKLKGAGAKLPMIFITRGIRTHRCSQEGARIVGSRLGQPVSSEPAAPVGFGAHSHG